MALARRDGRIVPFCLVVGDQRKQAVESERHAHYVIMLDGLFFRGRDIPFARERFRATVKQNP